MWQYLVTAIFFVLINHDNYNYILCRRCLAAANAEIIVSTLMLCITSFSSERSERLISRACPIVDRRWFLTNLSFENHLSPLHEPHVVAYNNVPAAARPAILLILTSAVLRLECSLDCLSAPTL